MPLNFSAAHSSRITKRPSTSKPPSLRRTTSSPFAQLRRQKSTLQRTVSKPETTSSLCNDLRNDHDGTISSPGPFKVPPPNIQQSSAEPVKDIPDAISHALKGQFDPVPDRGGGFSSTRIAETLNFRRKLPPLLTIAHLHSILGNPTRLERELVKLLRDGIVKKIVVPGRGAAGEALVLMKDLESMVQDSLVDVDENVDNGQTTLAQRFLDFLKRTSSSTLDIPLTDFSPQDITTLSRAGFLTSPSALYSPAAPTSGTGDTGTLTSIASIARSASGSLSAVGGHDALLARGGSGAPSGLRRSSSAFAIQSTMGSDEDLTFPSRPGAIVTLSLSLPSTGSHIKLVTSTLTHLLSLITKGTSHHHQKPTSFHEIPISILRERWNGSVADADSQTHQAKRYRGEFAGVLPARTKKWKMFYGMRCEWVIDEAVGRGLIERFQTGSVGEGVRMV